MMLIGDNWLKLWEYSKFNNTSLKFLKFLNESENVIQLIVRSVLHENLARTLC